MAQATVLRGGKMKIKLGDAASPEVFTSPCGFNTKSFSRTKNTSESIIPDCADEDAPAWVGTDVISLGWGVTGEGLLTAESVEMWDAFMDSTDVKNVQVEFEWPSPLGTITYEGQAHLTNFEITGPRGEKVTANVTLVGDGALVRTPAIT